MIFAGSCKRIYMCTLELLAVCVLQKTNGDWEHCREKYQTCMASLKTRSVKPFPKCKQRQLNVSDKISLITFLKIFLGAFRLYADRTANE